MYCRMVWLPLVSGISVNESTARKAPEREYNVKVPQSCKEDSLKYGKLSVAMKTVR